jgi:allantoin racemase
MHTHTEDEQAPADGGARKRVLVINPNTSASVTALVLQHCRRAQPQIEWQAATSRLGAPYISNEAACAIAAHAVLETYADHADGHDAVLIACFGDPGLLALREIAPVPVTSLAQASFEAAQRQGMFAVITGGRAWEPMLYRFARSHQLDAGLVGIHTVELTGAQIAESPDQALDALQVAAMQGVTAGAQSIVLGGAGLAGLANALQARVPVPVYDNVLLAAQWVADAIGIRGKAPPESRSAARVPLIGAGAALTALMGRSL